MASRVTFRSEYIYISAMLYSVYISGSHDSMNHFPDVPVLSEASFMLLFLLNNSHISKCIALYFYVLDNGKWTVFLIEKMFLILWKSISMGNHWDTHHTPDRII